MRYIFTENTENAENVDETKRNRYTGITACRAENGKEKDGDRMRKLIGALVTLLLLWGLCACGTREITPSQIFEGYLDKTVTVQPDVEAGSSAAEAAIMENVRYTIVEQMEDGVIIEVTAPDMGALLDRIVAGNGTAEDITAALERGEFTERTVTIAVELDENGRPVDSFTFLDAMYGGLYSWLAQLEQNAGAGE